jgi:hypothetical protein
MGCSDWYFSKSTSTVYVEQTIQPNSQWRHFVGETLDIEAISGVEPYTVIKVRFSVMRHTQMTPMMLLFMLGKVTFIIKLVD